MKDLPKDQPKEKPPLAKDTLKHLSAQISSTDSRCPKLPGVATDEGKDKSFFNENQEEDPESSEEEEEEILDEETFKTLPKEGMISAIGNVLRLENLPIAESQLELFKAQHGEGPEFFDLKAQLFRKKGEIGPNYETLKQLFYRFPVYLMDRRDFENVCEELFLEKLAEVKKQWDEITQLVAKHSTDKKTQTQTRTVLSLASKDKGVDRAGDLYFRERILGIVRKIEPVYKKILEIEPMHLDAIKGMVLCYRELDEPENLEKMQVKLSEAQTYWTELNKQHSDSVLAEAENSFTAGEIEKSIKIVNLGLELLPGNMKMLLAKVKYLQSMQKHKEALSCIEFLIKEHPDEKELHDLRREIQEGKLKEVLYLGSIALNEAYQFENDPKQRKAKVDKAQDFFYEALNIDENNVQAFEGIYRCHELSDRADKAKKTLDHIKEIDHSYSPEKLQAPPPKVTDQKGGGNECFVATRVFGSGDRRLEILRNFRNENLLPFFGGRIFAKLYGRVGPKLAKLPEKSLVFQALNKFLHFILPVQN